MNALVMYDSTYGITEEIAQEITDVLSERGSVRLLRVNKVQLSDLEEVDVLVLGCPTYKRKPTAAVLAFLDSVSKRSLEGISAAAFDTRCRRPWLLTGSAARRVLKRLREAGADVETPAESFFLASREGPLEEGESGRAADWALQILNTLDQL